MILGVVIGLAVGGAFGAVWHLVRHSALQADARTAEARLADARANSVQLTAQLQEATAAASAAEKAHAVSASELELLKRAADEMRSRASEERQQMVGTFAELSAEALHKNNEQFLALAETKLSQVQAAAQGDLNQRQQAIAQLLHPLSETLPAMSRVCRRSRSSEEGHMKG
jgi:DNA recombination protein RmuC